MSQYQGGLGWQPAPQDAAGPSSWEVQRPEAPLVQIGDITVSGHWVVTPQGSRPVAESAWAVADMSRTTRTTPTWAIVCAIVGFFFVFLFSLLFLLAKDERTDGWLQVTVSAPGFAHMTTIPVYNRWQVSDTYNRVAHARSIARNAQSSAGWFS